MVHTKKLYILLFLPTKFGLIYYYCMVPRISTDPFVFACPFCPGLFPLPLFCHSSHPGGGVRALCAAVPAWVRIGR